MGINECSKPASKSSWDSQDFGDVNMVLKMSIFASPLGHNELIKIWPELGWSFFGLNLYNLSNYDD